MVFSARILYDKDRSVQSILYAALTLPGWQHFTAVRPTKLLHRLPATKLF